MNKKSIKKSNYENKDGFLILNKWLKQSKLEQHWINTFNFRIAM